MANVNVWNERQPGHFNTSLKVNMLCNYSCLLHYLLGQIMISLRVWVRKIANSTWLLGP